MSPGFKRDELKERYDVNAIAEDEWHTYSGKRTSAIVTRCLSDAMHLSARLLNAGAGVYEIGNNGFIEVPLDLFITPIRNRTDSVCATVENLPFAANTFGAVVCVGEVMAYCDPRSAIAEFSRILVPGGTLVCDFGSSRSMRYLFRPSYGRSADVVTDSYNGSPERTWVYDPKYFDSILLSSGFEIKRRIGIHTWSALVRRFGISTQVALLAQRSLEWLRLPATWADVTTILAVRSSFER